MILGAEIGMILVGLFVLATGKLTLTSTKVVTGTPARKLGALLLLPIPAAYTAHGLLHGYFVTRGKSVGPGGNFFRTMTALEGAIVVVCLVTVYAVGWVLATNPGGPAGEARLAAGVDADGTGSLPH